ncbi:MAG: hypothetical protein KJ623_01740 [Nanoarchaeota archaeon]|nr:hypothetical protein [Nanoarchaeota archaeon]
MIFEIDVSGEDILNKNYTICIAGKNNNIIKGFKFDQDLIEKLNSNYRSGNYKYKNSRKGKVSFKIRLYSLVIYYCFKSLNIKENISLNLCKDFYGKEEDIKVNLKYFLGDILKLRLDRFCFARLDKDSNAHVYSHLMRKDKNNKLPLI